jgi:hypothetical protein
MKIWFSHTPEVPIVHVLYGEGSVYNHPFSGRELANEWLMMGVLIRDKGINRGFYAAYAKCDQDKRHTESCSGRACLVYSRR